MHCKYCNISVTSNTLLEYNKINWDINIFFLTFGPWMGCNTVTL